MSFIRVFNLDYNGKVVVHRMHMNEVCIHNVRETENAERNISICVMQCTKVLRVSFKTLLRLTAKGEPKQY